VSVEQALPPGAPNHRNFAQQERGLRQRVRLRELGEPEMAMGRAPGPQASDQADYSQPMRSRATATSSIQTLRAVLKRS